jgi:Oxidoreductase molybdopterin binding domain
MPGSRVWARRLPALRWQSRRFLTTGGHTAKLAREYGENPSVAGEELAVFDRRMFLAGAGVAAFGGPALAAEGAVTLPFGDGARPLVRMPQKREMILLTTRPPQLETPFAVFNDGLLTPNDAFFVRYHLSGLPTVIDPATFRLRVGGHVGKPLELSLASLKRDFPVSEIVAVNQCSGNSRGFVQPRVGGGQLGNGAMGNARWRGMALKHLDEVNVADAQYDGYWIRDCTSLNEVAVGNRVLTVSAVLHGRAPDAATGRVELAQVTLRRVKSCWLFDPQANAPT